MTMAYDVLNVSIYFSSEFTTHGLNWNDGHLGIDEGSIEITHF